MKIMDNYKKLTAIFIISILSLARYNLPLRLRIPVFAFEYSFLGFETRMVINSFYMFNLLSQLALPIAAYLLVININQIKNLKKIMVYTGLFAVLSQVAILFVNMSYSQIGIFTSAPISPLSQFFTGGNFFHMLFWGLVAIVTYEKLKTRKYQIFAFIPFGLAMVIAISLNLSTILASALFITSIILSNLLINHLPIVDVNENKKRNKFSNILIPALIVFMYGSWYLLPSTSYILGMALILYLHIAIKNNFGHAKTLAIVVLTYYSLIILSHFLFISPEAMPSTVFHVVIFILPAMLFSMLGVLLIRMFSVSEEQIERNHIANIVGSGVYPLAILFIHFSFIM